MRGLDPATLHSVPLSKQDTRGNTFLWLCNLLSWCTTVAGIREPLKFVLAIYGVFNDCCCWLLLCSC